MPRFVEVRGSGTFVVTGGTGVFAGMYVRTADETGVTHTLGAGWGVGIAVGTFANVNLNVNGGPSGFHLFAEGLAAIGALVGANVGAALDSEGMTLTGGLGFTPEKYPIGAGAAAGVAFTWRTTSVEQRRPLLYMAQDATAVSLPRVR